MDPTGQPDPATPSRSGPPWVLPLLGSLAAIVLIVGVIVWATTRGGGEITSATSTLAPPTSDATVSTTTTPATTTTLPATTTTSSSTTTTTSSTTTTTTPPPSGNEWTVSSPNFPQPLVLTRSAESDGVAVYDGQQAVGDGAIRCLAVVVTGTDGWQEWCGPANVGVRFVAMAGIDPWLVEAGAAPGDVRLTVQEPTWALQTNGCTAPIGTLMGTAGLRAQVAVGVVCAGDTAIVEFGGVLLQPGGADGGLTLVELGDEGWNLVDGGTSLACVGPDGVDRCAAFGASGTLDDAALPIPPLDMLPTTVNVVDVVDVTTTARGWIGETTDPAAIADLIEDQLVDPGAEAPAAVKRSNGLDGGRTDLIVVEVPQPDDAVQTVTTAVWIDATATRSPILNATSWSVCARGVSAGVCV